MSQSKFVVLGGGMVAGYLAKQLVESGWRGGELTILSADSFPPYERPPLSKGFLAGRDSEDSLRINPEDFYREHGIDLKLNSQVAGIDAPARRVWLANGAEFNFEQLVIATGSRVRHLEIPGAGLGNVHYLRSLGDSKVIRARAEGVKRAVVIGGGFIGLETAAVLAQKGIEVTMIVRQKRIWPNFFSPEMSAFFEDYYRARHVRVIKDVELAELQGDQKVAALVLADGQTIPCEMVVAGIGVQPETDIFADSGIAVDNGILVNEFLETSVEGVLAAGDVANYYDVLFEKRRHAEHWDNAVSQGQHCARRLLGDRQPFRHVPYFFSDVFDLSYEFWGDSEGAEETIIRGDLKDAGFSVWWLRKSMVVAAFVMKRPDEEREIAPKWIEQKQEVSANKLKNAKLAVGQAAVPA